MTSQTSTLGAKHHYKILDGLRGVAALMVVIFHTCEAHTFGNRFKLIINHGYMAVDFFFLLSGFVVAYAYDDRWGRMSTWEFFKRRLIRLQPMVVAGSAIGAALYYFGASPMFPTIAGTPVWKLLLVMLVGMTLLPVPKALDIRGWEEMHPLDGPGWSLFYEYVANVLYALVLRRLSKAWLGVLALITGVWMGEYLLFGNEGDVIGGWAPSLEGAHLGFMRLLFPFLVGMLLMRSGWRVRVRGAFPLCSVLLVGVMVVPRLGGQTHLWWNGLYEFVCIAVVFPLVVAIGAGAELGGRVARVSDALGGLSYPLYITHYPLIYLYTEWVAKNPPLRQSVPAGVLVFVTAVAIGWGCLRLYDEPVRAWLTRRFDRRSRSVPGGLEGAAAVTER